MTKIAGSLNHKDIFESLKTLLGHWHGIDEQNRPTKVHYTLTANGSALVEDWAFDNDMEALTIYHMDGSLLMATHYCPIGNQPRLDLKRQSEDGTLFFECVSATHLTSFKDPHEHAFNLKLNKDGSFYREETYVEKSGELESNGILFARVK
jgi:DNA-binding PadR family transcriptional regulator